jgi:hypothetical protein
MVEKERERASKQCKRDVHAQRAPPGVDRIRTDGMRRWQHALAVKREQGQMTAEQRANRRQCEPWSGWPWREETSVNGFEKCAKGQVVAACNSLPSLTFQIGSFFLFLPSGERSAVGCTLYPSTARSLHPPDRATLRRWPLATGALSGLSKAGYTRDLGSADRWGSPLSIPLPSLLPPFVPR